MAYEVKWEYDDRIGQWINPKTGEIRPESYSQDEHSEDSVENDNPEENNLRDNSREEEEETSKPAFTLSREQIGQGMRLARDENTDDPVPCPNCGRDLVLVPRESKLFHVCCSLLESEYPSCDFFERVVKESTKPDYPRSGTGKKAKKVATVLATEGNE